LWSQWQGLLTGFGCKTIKQRKAADHEGSKTLAKRHVGLDCLTKICQFFLFTASTEGLLSRLYAIAY